MTVHADLIARMEEIATRPDCTYPGHMLDAAMIIKALVCERDEALRHVEQLQDKLDPEHSCACCYDRPDITCGHHSPMLAKAEAERDEARAALREARAAMHAVVTGDYPNPRDHRPGQCKHGTFYWVDCGQCIDEWLEAAVARIDTLLAKTEGTT
jgi:hypothetical protein